MNNHQFPPPYEAVQYRLVCKSCGWKGQMGAASKNECPACKAKLHLESSESRRIMRDAINKTLAPQSKAEPVVTVRSLRDKDAPKDEGEWEFKLKDGVLEVIAWSDDKTEAQCIRLVRRGTQIHLMQMREQSDE